MMRQTQTNYIDSQVIEYQVSTEVKDELKGRNLTLINTLNLSGGIPTESIRKIIHEVKFIPTVSAFAASTLSQEHKVERKVFVQEKTVINLSMKVSSTNRGIGTNLLINQIKEARKLGFRFLKVSAAKGKHLNGYYTWARLGYSMEKPDYEDFIDLMKSFSRKERSIGELMTTKEGRDFWEQNGFWWEGEFDLKDNSDNMTTLMNYLTSKGINVSF